MKWLREGTFVYELTENLDRRTAHKTPMVNKWSLQVQGNGTDGITLEERKALATLIQATPQLKEVLDELYEACYSSSHQFTDRMVALLPKAKALKEALDGQTETD